MSDILEPPDPPALELTILMPCLDEAETIGGCVRAASDYLKRANIQGEVLVADNGSTDGSQRIAESLGARVVAVPARGYGAALLGGIAAARGKYIVMGDADGSYDLGHLDPFVAKLRAGYDLVMGNRMGRRSTGRHAVPAPLSRQSRAQRHRPGALPHRLPRLQLRAARI